MNITTTAQDFDLSVPLDAFVRSRLKNTLGKLEADIMAIDVFLKDANGPKGGVDKQVLIRVQLRGQKPVAIEYRHESMYAAIRIAVKGARRAIRRRLRKARRIDRLRLMDAPLAIPSGAYRA